MLFFLKVKKSSFCKEYKSGATKQTKKENLIIIINKIQLS